MKDNSAPRFHLEVCDNPGDEPREYTGYDNLSPATANILLLNFSLFRLLLHALAILLGSIIGQLLFRLF